MLPIFYINLDSRPDRREFMEEQFAALGLDAERVQAITVAEVPEELAADITRPGRLWRVNRADLACGLTHQKIWATMIARGIPEALVLEDDALLAPAIRDFLSDGILRRLGADLVKLETRRNKVRLGSTVVNFGAVAVRELASSHLGSAAYLISHAIAKAALARANVNDMAVDRFLFGQGGPHLWRARILQADPSPAIQLDRLLQNGKGYGAPPQSALAQSDIATHRMGRPDRSEVRRGRNPLGLIRIELEAAGLKLPILLRHPALLFRSKKPVPFAGDA